MSDPQHFRFSYQQHMFLSLALQYAVTRFWSMTYLLDLLVVPDKLKGTLHNSLAYSLRIKKKKLWTLASMFKKFA